MRIPLLILAVLASVNAHAQQKPQLSVQVYISSEDAAAKCGITKPGLESILALTLRNNGVEAAAETTNPLLHFRVGVLNLDDSCVFSLEASVKGFRNSDRAKDPLGAFKARSYTNTVLCSSGYYGVWNRSDIAAKLLREAETATKVCLGQLAY